MKTSPSGRTRRWEVNTVIEVPKGSSNKYKYAPDGDLFRYDHTLFSPLFYPCDYGWICGTKGKGERKPLNILVMASNPTFAGCLVVARPVGALLMHDSKGEDHKVLVRRRRGPPLRRRPLAERPVRTHPAGDPALL